MATVKWAPSRKHLGCALAAYGLSAASIRTSQLVVEPVRQDRAPTARWGLKGLR